MPSIEDHIDDSDNLYEHHTFVADPKQGLLRIDKFLINKLINTSRNRIQNAAKNGCVLVNQVQVKSNYKVKPNDKISIVLPFPPRDKDIHPENIPLNIVYEDDQIVIINKVAGMVVHPAYGNFEGTLVNALLYHFDNLPDRDGDKIRPGLAHRIDKDTSGLLVIAKTEEALTFLAKQFFDHSIERKYIALVWGTPKIENGTIESYLGRDIRDRKKMYSFDSPDQGKHAVTHYKLLESFGYVSLIECELETGRTHQIRVHLSSIGHPIFSDATYGGDRICFGPSFSKYKQFVSNCFQMMPRQALHAKSLGVVHPNSKKNVFFDSELPEDMQNVILKWKNYSDSSI